MNPLRTARLTLRRPLDRDAGLISELMNDVGDLTQIEDGGVRSAEDAFHCPNTAALYRYGPGGLEAIPETIYTPREGTNQIWTWNIRCSSTKLSTTCSPRTPAGTTSVTSGSSSSTPRTLNSPDSINTWTSKAIEGRVDVRLAEVEAPLVIEQPVQRAESTIEDT